MQEEEDLIAEWIPEPLVPNPPEADHPSLNTRTVYGKVGRYIDLGTGEKVLNLGTHSYLNLGERPEVEEAALQCLHKYGVGSCGPRGFYGTTQVHLELEDRLAAFFNCEMAVLYSYGFSTIASAIPAYSKSGDIIYADEMVSFPIQRGLQASRSRIVFFRHNDVEHLEELLKEQAVLDKKDSLTENKKAKVLASPDKLWGMEKEGSPSSRLDQREEMTKILKDMQESIASLVGVLSRDPPRRKDV
ncbi:serine palmitoyltransferase 1-like [Macrobrachium nipponense]|uniref:serine palmitoyltransferase 1-like n=1 Tax=Macrobrachium nipponense TaxID=159736 RepID=UPI0030C80DC6